MYQSIVEAILQHAAESPEKFCLADDSTAVNYGEYSQMIRRYAAYFAGLGLTKGQKAVIEANQTVPYLAMQMGLQLIGGVFVPVEHNCAAQKVVSFADSAHAELIVVNDPKRIEDGRVKGYDAVCAAAAGTAPLEVMALPASDTICELLFSTGTTGKEKGIIITHSNNIALAENVINGVEMQPDNVELIPSPLNHSHGLRRYYANMFNGSSVVLLGSVMNLAGFFGDLDRYGVTSMDLVPSALAVVLKLSKGKLAEYADRLRYIQIGSAPLLQKDVDLLCSLLPKTHMYNFYGSTESGCSCIYDFNCSNAKKNCIGKPTWNTRVLVVDDDRNPIDSSPEHTGLIATAGGMNTLGYWEDEAETRSAVIDGVIYSKDMGYIDADGDIILLGRKGDVINVGGNKVSPEEIENAAIKMACIADCGCIAVPDPSKGQVPKLFVQMNPGEAFDAKAIRAFLAAQLEPYKVPAYLTEIEKIPRTFNGKLLRKNLK